VTFRLFFNLPGVFEKTGTFIADILWIPPGKLDFAGTGCFYPVLDQNCCHTKDKTYKQYVMVLCATVQLRIALIRFWVASKIRSPGRLGGVGWGGSAGVGWGSAGSPGAVLSIRDPIGKSPPERRF
jgi:hypothetical protein